MSSPLELPFGFGISISEIQNDFNITKNGSTVVGLSTVSFTMLCLTLAMIRRSSSWFSNSLSEHLNRLFKW
jgi:hypothetical protein